MDLGDIMKMLKDPQALQRQAAEMQSKVASISAKGSAGGGMVSVTLNGAMDLIAIEISPEVMVAAETGILQDLIRAAHNDASEKIKQAMQSEVARSMGAGGIPGFGQTGA